MNKRLVERILASLEDEKKESTIPFDDAVKFINSHDGHRFEAVRYLTSRMKQSDLRLITDHCLNLERSNRN